MQCFSPRAKATGTEVYAVWAESDQTWPKQTRANINMAITVVSTFSQHEVFGMDVQTHTKVFRLLSIDLSQFHAASVSGVMCFLSLFFLNQCEPKSVHFVCNALGVFKMKSASSGLSARPGGERRLGSSRTHQDFEISFGRRSSE